MLLKLFKSIQHLIKNVILVKYIIPAKVGIHNPTFFASKRLSSFGWHLHCFAPAKAGIYCFILYFCTSCVPTADVFSELSSEDVEDRFYIKFDVDHYTGQGVAVPLYELSSEDRIGLIDCGVDKDTESIEDIYCTLDLNEADIGVLGQAEEGIPIQYNVPREMCRYTTFMAPWHWNYRSGLGPPLLQKYTIEESDTNTIQVSVGGVNTGSEENNDDEYYCIPPNCGTPSSPPSTSACETAQRLNQVPAAGIWCRVDEENNISKVFCPYDHSTDSTNTDKPNCCFGTYRVIGGDEGEEENDWGGNIKECIGGPIRISNWEAYSKTPYGDLPIPLVTSSWTRGLRHTLTVGPIIDSVVFPQSVPTANYFDGIEDLIFTDLLSCSNCPGMLLPDNTKPLPAPNLRAYPYFTLECLNSNYEALHSVHLIIREWNTKEEFISFKDSDGRSGDPDLEGEEGRDCNYYEADEKLLGRTNCNDFLDFDDYLSISTSPLNSIIQEDDIDLPYPHIDYDGSAGGGG